MNKSTKKIAKRIALIACSKSKADSKSKAENLYRGNLFKLSLTYAKKLQIDRIYILSDKFVKVMEEVIIDLPRPRNKEIITTGRLLRV